MSIFSIANTQYSQRIFRYTIWCYLAVPGTLVSRMIEHPGGRIYDTVMLKPKVWRTMGKTMANAKYWTSWVKRSAHGIVDAVTSKNSISGPYSYMRIGMMLGTIVSIRQNMVILTTKDPDSLVVLNMLSGMSKATCSSALTKMTAAMYQAGIDITKHGNEQRSVKSCGNTRISFKTQWLKGISFSIGNNGKGHQISERVYIEGSIPWMFHKTC
ncbi:hypothetical protein EX30DRAFT_34602 [Ascodesmis nigricans]|uniref:Uncharacterized protein n=1 Tax=Ascodesmis nigricans TaxID=341454 RepID=A0A4S2MWK0_9PEZI|nr:hypothetical protein EX30DRAFT_34602 [Ascodesmis nigricans]